MPPSSKPELGDKEAVVVMLWTLVGDVVVDIVLVVGVLLHFSVIVPGTVQLNLAEGKQE